MASVESRRVVVRLLHEAPAELESGVLGNGGAVRRRGGTGLRNTDTEYRIRIRVPRGTAELNDRGFS